MAMVSIATALIVMQGVSLCIGQEIRFLASSRTTAPSMPLPSSLEGEGEGTEEEGEGTSESDRTLIYDVLRRLNPNTLNVTIYWSCISADYAYLSEYGEFQQGDETYKACENDGHLLFERSCLHNMLVPLNCFDGTWDCGSQWVDNVDYTLQWLRNIAIAWPQCYGDYSELPGYTLTWDCEERCDLPCTYPEEFCNTVKKSYNISECRLDCAVEASSYAGGSDMETDSVSNSGESVNSQQQLDSCDAELNPCGRSCAHAPTSCDEFHEMVGAGGCAAACPDCITDLFKELLGCSGHPNRRLHETAHAMTLIIGNHDSSEPGARATPSPSGPIDTDSGDESWPTYAPPTPAPKKQKRGKGRSEKRKRGKSRKSRKSRGGKNQKEGKKGGKSGKRRVSKRHSH